MIKASKGWRDVRWKDVRDDNDLWWWWWAADQLPLLLLLTMMTAPLDSRDRYYINHAETVQNILIRQLTYSLATTLSMEQT